MCKNEYECHDIFEMYCLYAPMDLGTRVCFIGLNCSKCVVDVALHLSIVMYISYIFFMKIDKTTAYMNNSN